MELHHAFTELGLNRQATAFQAKAAYRDAAKAFAGSAAELSALRQTATTLGVPGV